MLGIRLPRERDLNDAPGEVTVHELGIEGPPPVEVCRVKNALLKPGEASIRFP